MMEHKTLVKQRFLQISFIGLIVFATLLIF